jgi:ribosome biogenesis GTPase
MTAPAPPGVLARYGWSDRVAALASLVEPGLVPARVVRVDRDRCVCVTAGGERTATAAHLPAVGDWVALDGTEVAEVLPRWSRLARHGAGDAITEQVLAANVDLVLVVNGLDRAVKPSRVERELVVAWESGARPLVVLNKADACTEPGGAEAVKEALADRVHADVVVTSAADGQGVEAVRAGIGPADTIVLIGASGVGKSSLANRLLGGDTLETRAVRASDGKGRHTTSARHLLAMPGGGCLIDTPGTRSLGLLDASEGMAQAFSDVDALATGCRFDDCVHDAEPDCAVQAAVEAGELSGDRLGSWRKLGREAAWAEARLDARARAQAHRRAKVMSRAMKQRGNRP